MSEGDRALWTAVPHERERRRAHKREREKEKENTLDQILVMLIDTNMNMLSSQTRRQLKYRRSPYRAPASARTRAGRMKEMSEIKERVSVTMRTVLKE
jgi:hypothetical protein